VSTIMYFNNKRDILPVIAPGLISFGEPEVFDEYVVSIDTAEELLRRTGRKQSLDMLDTLEYKRALAGPPPRRFHAPSLLLVLSLLALFCISVLGAYAIIKAVTP